MRLGSPKDFNLIKSLSTTGGYLMPKASHLPTVRQRFIETGQTEKSDPKGIEQHT
jgi:hypothetical protein